MRKAVPKDEGQQYGKIYLPRSDKISVQSEDVDLLNEDQIDWGYKA